MKGRRKAKTEKWRIRDRFIREARGHDHFNT